MYWPDQSSWNKDERISSWERKQNPIVQIIGSGAQTKKLKKGEMSAMKQRKRQRRLKWINKEKENQNRQVKKNHVTLKKKKKKKPIERICTTTYLIWRNRESDCVYKKQEYTSSKGMKIGPRLDFYSTLQ